MRKDERQTRIQNAKQQAFPNKNCCEKKCSKRFQTKSLLRAKSLWQNSSGWCFLQRCEKCRSQILFSLEWNIIGCYSENNTNDSTPGNSRCNPSLLFKVFFQGAVYLRVFTMCTSIGDTPPHLSPYFPWKGLAFVHFLYLWYTLVYLSCLYLVIWKLYYSVIFLSCHMLIRSLMKSSKCQFLHFNNKASWYSNFTL